MEWGETMAVDLAALLGGQNSEEAMQSQYAGAWQNLQAMRYDPNNPD